MPINFSQDHIEKFSRAGESVFDSPTNKGLLKLENGNWRFLSVGGKNVKLYRYFNDHGPKWELEKTLKRQPDNFHIFRNGCFLRFDCIREILRYRERFPSYQDAAFWLRAIKKINEIGPNPCSNE